MFQSFKSNLFNRESRDSEMILGGDWNCILNVNKDVQGPKSNFYGKQMYLQKLIKNLELCDVWRKTHKKIRQFTWRNVSLKRASRLDFWLVDKDVYKRTISTDIRPAIRADHNAISLKVNLHDIKKGPGYWKLNTSVLSDKLYQKKIYDIIQSLSEMKVSAMEKWELLKIKVKEYTQRFCRKRSVIEKNIRSILEERLRSLEIKIDVNVHNAELENYYSKVKTKLEKIYQVEAKGAGIRARVKWIEQGERSTKYFLGLEKNSVRKKEIKQLKSQNGKRTIRKQEEIIKEVRRFYAQLYNNESKNVEEMKKYVFTQNINQLSNDDKETCDGLLTVDECKHAILTMKKINRQVVTEFQ